jgi:hypothetical protein
MYRFLLPEINILSYVPPVSDLLSKFCRQENTEFKYPGPQTYSIEYTLGAEFTPVLQTQLGIFLFYT